MAKSSELVMSAFFVLFAFGCIAASLQLPLGTPLEPMPGFIPLIVSLFLLFVSLAQFATAFRTAGNSKAVLGEQWKQPASIVVGLIVYSITLDFLGYIIATTGLSLLIIRIFEPQGWLRPLVIAIAVSVFSYVLFDRLLEVNLPDGLLRGLL
ncbi:tripartite tricarboxylate transporter TctB family protein [Microvirga zambiensis]|uniref:tripartite tricarboxylate transporter TctB family protein n=1 Tax=Microvirga zambiensis TaxID=1402137 RepID=UPI00191CC909|nr:tripartite tricarboxylate transporter TctB family protein [Microvirga zambiensis]